MQPYFNQTRKIMEGRGGEGRGHWISSSENGRWAETNKSPVHQMFFLFLFFCISGTNAIVTQECHMH